MKKNLNQKLINLIEYYSLNNINLILSDKPLKRNSNFLSDFDNKSKKQKLDKLRNKISLIKNCELKKVRQIWYLLMVILTQKL